MKSKRTTEKPIVSCGMILQESLISRLAVRRAQAMLMFGALVLSNALASEWKPISPTEKLLYDISFEQESPGNRPSSVKCEGNVLVAEDHGSKVLHLTGRETGITLPSVQLTECQLGNQNPTLITFNLKLDAADEFRIVNEGGATPIVFAHLGKGGAVFDGAETKGIAAIQRGSLKAGQWYQVYINFDPSFKGYYLSFTGGDGERVEFRRRVKEVSYDFSLAITASASRGKVSLDNIRGITGFALDKMPKQPHFPQGDTYEPQPVVTTLTMAPASPDMTVRSGTLFETVKLAVHPHLENDSILVPALETFRALGATVHWEADDGLLTARKDEIEIRVKAGSMIAAVNGTNRNLSQPPVAANGRLSVPLELFNFDPDLKAAWMAADQRVTITSGQVRRTLSTRPTNDGPSGDQDILVGAVPPAEPRTPVALKYTFNEQSDRLGICANDPAS